MGHTRSGKRQKLTFVLATTDEPSLHLGRPSVASSSAFASVSHSSRHQSDRPLQAPSLQYQIAEASQLQQSSAGLEAPSTGQPERLSWTENAVRIVQRPGLLLTLIPKPVVLFGAGAVAGAIGKTVTAPLDRVKLLLQTQGALVEGALGQAIRNGNLWQAFATIGREEGLRGYWKGNTPQILRVIPYSATQLYSYEVLKRVLRGPDGQLSLPARFTAGGCAGIIASLVTYPLDTLRLRLAVDPAARSLQGASRVLFREGSYQAYFRGLGPSLIGIFPYMALELAVFDLLSDKMPEGGAFGRGFLSAFVATTCCYPLDTIRRQIQLQSRGRMSMMQATRLILQRDGVPGMYRGFVPNALKNLPNKGIRLATFDTAKRMIAASEAAAQELEASH